MRVAVSRDGLAVGEPVIVETPKKFLEGVARLREIASSLAGKERITAAAGGIAGPLGFAPADTDHREKTLLGNAPHLADWAGRALKKELDAALGVPVFLENDTAMVGLGEAVAGAGKGYGIVAYITVSTGVNGVRVVDGRIDRNIWGFEIGHSIINADGVRCFCGGRGHLEAYVSGTAIRRRYGARAEALSSARSWDEIARHLASGINNTVVYWSPDIIVVGGAVAKKIPFDRVRRHLASALKIFPSAPPVEPAILGETAGLRGALVFLNQRLSIAKPVSA